MIQRVFPDKVADMAESAKLRGTLDKPGLKPVAARHGRGVDATNANKRDGREYEEPAAQGNKRQGARPNVDKTPKRWTQKI